MIIANSTPLINFAAIHLHPHAKRGDEGKGTVRTIIKEIGVTVEEFILLPRNICVIRENVLRNLMLDARYSILDTGSFTGIKHRGSRIEHRLVAAGDRALEMKEE